MIKLVKHFQIRDSIGGNLSCAASGVDIENKDFAPFLPFQLIFYFLSSAIEFIVITSVIVPYATDVVTSKGNTSGDDVTYVSDFQISAPFQNSASTCVKQCKIYFPNLNI